MHAATIEAFQDELEKIAVSAKWIKARAESGLAKRLSGASKKSFGDGLWNYEAKMGDRVRKGKDSYYATEGSRNPSHWAQHRRHERNVSVLHHAEDLSNDTSRLRKPKS